MLMHSSHCRGLMSEAAEQWHRILVDPVPGFSGSKRLRDCTCRKLAGEPDGLIRDNKVMLVNSCSQARLVDKASILRSWVATHPLPGIRVSHQRRTLWQALVEPHGIIVI